MRLTPHQTTNIKSKATEVFGEAEVYLFGSRVDDSARGGDIDLYIKVLDKTELFKKKIEFLAKLKRAIGEQKIDVVFDTDPSRTIEQEAIKNGVKL